MASLTIDYVGGDEDLARALHAYFAQHGVSSEVNGISVMTNASTFEQCDQIGRLVADFIEQWDISLPIHIDGPGADNVLYETRTNDDAKVISSCFASSAFLQ